MKVKTFSGCSLLLGLTICTIGHSFASTEVAKINGKVITIDEFNRKFPLLQPLYQNKVATKSDVLEDLIKRELGIQEARKLGLEKDPEVQEEIQTVLYQALLKRTLSKEFEKITVTEKEAEGWYSKNPEVRTSHIFIQVLPNVSKEEEKKAFNRIKEIQDKELKSGKSFSEVAQKFSEGVAAPMGGDIDYQGRDRLDPNYYQAALGLKKPGNVSGIIRTQFGYHIIRLTAIRPWAEANHAAIKNQLFSDKKQALFEKYMKDLRAKASVQVNAQALK
jgi:parvulin-like peptidyl-prolyl isomerase